VVLFSLFIIIGNETIYPQGSGPQGLRGSGEPQKPQAIIERLSLKYICRIGKGYEYSKQQRKNVCTFGNGKDDVGCVDDCDFYPTGQLVVM
jgi:hypothetical protein